VKTIRILRIKNGARERRDVVLEPWGMPIALESNALLELEVHIDDGGDESVDCEVGEGVTTVFLGSGTRVVARVNGAEVYSRLDGPAVPPVPAGMSTRGFLKLVLKPEP
jgi:hypothetical protein